MAVKRHINCFLRREDGSLLVFFMVSTVTILGIIALSYDLGRRAATQTDMQSFVDNVVLAAAGELNGTPDAISNATAAANSVIQSANERLKEGTAGQEFTIALDQIVFYENVPALDTPPSFDPEELSDPASASYKYRLPPSDLGGTPNPLRARYVGVRLATVDVAWIFAGIFSASDLPDQAVGATAVAGNAIWTCDISPLVFCLPGNGAGGPLSLVPGQGARLTAARQIGLWRPGEFGFVNVETDPAGNCAGLTEEAARQACLVTASSRITACFQPQRTDVIPGQRPAQESAAFNMSLDIFDQSMIQFFNEALYAPGPHSVNGRVPANSGEICAPSQPSPNTVAFPLDDCHASACIDGPFGDGNWSTGRENYTQTNYSMPPASNPSVADGTFFEFPETNLTRYEYYLREIERAENGGVMDAAGSGAYSAPRFEDDNDGGRGTGSPEDPDTEWSTWDDFWPDELVDVYNPIIPDLPVIYEDERTFDNGLPQCNRNFSLPPGPDRRLLLAAGIHCPSSGAVVTGSSSDVEIIEYYRVFQLGPTENELGLPPIFDLNVEIVERIPLDALGTNRQVVQLVR